MNYSPVVFGPVGHRFELSGFSRVRSYPYIVNSQSNFIALDQSRTHCWEPSFPETLHAVSHCRRRTCKISQASVSGSRIFHLGSAGRHIGGRETKGNDLRSSRARIGIARGAWSVDSALSSLAARPGRADRRSSVSCHCRRARSCACAWASPGCLHKWSTEPGREM